MASFVKVGVIGQVTLVEPGALPTDPQDFLGMDKVTKNRGAVSS